MYIDFHSHAFADKIAGKAIEVLKSHLALYGYPDDCYSDGTIADTEKFYKNSIIDKAVLMPIATKPSQHEIINNWAAAQNNSEVFYCFGSVHPKGFDALKELERIKALGLYGIKLHPDYQEFFVDDESVFPVYKKCAELGLPVMFHAGLDAICPDTIHCTPQRAVTVLDAVPGLTAIFAHMGGNTLWRDVYGILAGRDCYLDTSYSITWEDENLMRGIIEKHGADKMLFGSDFPWDDPEKTVRDLRKLGLTESEYDNIFYKNAVRLLNI
ncbi:MAG: amidohydrolase family protein [Ruminococcus sp.]|nr:amidohydrolase family protein [Ruminococcus sp.]